MATYGPSRAKPNVTHQSRHNPLNGNKTSSLLQVHNPNNNNNTNNNNPVTNVSSHPQYRITHQPKPQTEPTDTETNNGWHFGVGLIKSVWSNVVKPALIQNNTATTQESNVSPPAQSNISPLPLQENEYNDHICQLLDSDALTERVREIVQLDEDIDGDEDDDILQYDIFKRCDEPKTHQKKHDNDGVYVTTHFEDLIDGNLVHAAHHPIHHKINESVANDRKRARMHDNIQNNNEPPRKRPKIENNPQSQLPAGVIRSRPKTQTHTNVTRALQKGIDIIRQCTPLQTRKRGRNALEQISIQSELESAVDGDFAPPQAKKARIAPPTATPILSQETEASEAESVISRRDFRLHRVKEDETPKVSICCSIAVLQERKRRYLRVYRQRFSRIYSKYKLQNVAVIDGWMSVYGGDVDKLHDLYENICVKYDLYPGRKYEGQVAEHEPNENEEEVSKSCRPIIPKPIKIDVDLLQKTHQLTRANVDRHTKSDSLAVTVDNGSVADKSDTSQSTFHTPKTDKFKDKDIDIQSTKSDTLPFVYDMGKNEKWGDTADLSLMSKFEYGGGFTAGFSENTLSKMDACNDESGAEIFGDEAMKFMIPDTLPPTNMDAQIHNNQNNNNNNNNMMCYNNQNNSRGNNYNPFARNCNVNNNNEWNMNNNNPSNANFNAMNNNQPNNNWSNSNNENNNNNNWSTMCSNNTNNNEFNFDANNNGNNSRSCSVDQSFFTPSSKKKKKGKKYKRKTSF